MRICKSPVHKAQSAAHSTALPALFTRNGAIAACRRSVRAAKLGCNGISGRFVIKLIFGAALCAAIALAAALPARAETALDTMFPGAKAIGSTNWEFKKAGPVVQWKAMLDRFKQQQVDCAPADGCGKFKALVASLSGLSTLSQIKAVKQAERGIVYKEDIQTAGVSEYWATPYETLSTNSGDTEDYAILAYFALREAGMPAASMRVMAVRLKSQGGIGHAVLAIDTTPEPLILDNRTPAVLPANLLGKELTPVLAVNEEGWWVYVSAAQ